MNKGIILFLTLAITSTILLYAGGEWRIAGFVLFGILVIWTIVKMLSRKEEDSIS